MSGESSLPRQKPITKRRLAGTKAYAARNYFVLGLFGVTSVLALPFIYFTDVKKNRWLNRKTSDADLLRFKKMHMGLPLSLEKTAEGALKAAKINPDIIPIEEVTEMLNRARKLRGEKELPPQ